MNWFIPLTLIVFIAIQFIPPKLTYNSINKEKLNLPVKVASILQNSCFDCHSNQGNLKWYDNIAPVSWLVNSDIKKAKSVLNFSEWNQLTEKEKTGKLYYSLNKILSNEMPLKSYKLLHGTTISDDDILTLKDYVQSRSPRKAGTSSNKQNDHQSPKIANIPREIEDSANGIKYIPNYKNWKVISTTDRFDNGTMRIIYGNNIAIEAIKNQKINPWPDGSIIAKVAWKQIVDSDGNVNTDDFVQVEYMIKDKNKYAKSKGWGWARWRGNDLKPYGKNKDFANECISCHIPVKNNDYMFTTPLKFIKPAIFKK